MSSLVGFLCFAQDTLRTRHISAREISHCTHMFNVFVSLALLKLAEDDGVASTKIENMYSPETDFGTKVTAIIAGELLERCLGNFLRRGDEDHREVRRNQRKDGKPRVASTRYSG